MNECRYSVLMSIYSKEKASNLVMALDSTINQTVKPSEIVLVKDGLLTPELDAVLDEYDKRYPGLFNFVTYENNMGLGYALSKGILACSNELIARMDTDDYAFPDRIELELAEFDKNPELDMLGTQVYEFIDSPDKPISVSNLPLSHSSIVSYSKRRNPFRHTPMMYKRGKVLQAGNYVSDFLYFEDWDLFNRMLANKCIGKNIDLPLIAMRVSPDFFARRGGRAYLPYVWKFKYAQLKRGYFTLSDFLVSFIPHVIVCLIPNKLRSIIYTKALRKTFKYDSSKKSNLPQ